MMLLKAANCGWMRFATRVPGIQNVSNSLAVVVCMDSNRRVRRIEVRVLQSLRRINPKGSVPRQSN